MTLDNRTLEQISAIKLNKNKPLIISDVDEVLVYFAAPLEAFLNSKDMSIAFTSYKLFGNVYSTKTNELIPKAEVISLLEVFFAESIHTCPLVDGAKAALDNLSKDFQVLILTNTPHSAKTKRINALNNLGINFPLITNEGHKGEAVKTICSELTAPAIFLDDIPHHHSSVAKTAPQVQRMHFVADPRLAKLLPKAEHSHQRIDNWPETESYIYEYFSKNT